VRCARVNFNRSTSRWKNGLEMVSAKFVIPYPPGFPITVPGQVVTTATITFMRKLDVNEIRGFNATKGLELPKPEAPAAHKGASSDNAKKGRHKS
jgi:arginine decarboxylase